LGKAVILHIEIAGAGLFELVLGQRRGIFSLDLCHHLAPHVLYHKAVEHDPRPLAEGECETMQAVAYDFDIRRRRVFGRCGRGGAEAVDGSVQGNSVCSVNAKVEAV